MHRGVPPTKVTFQLKLQIHENWRLDYSNAPNHEFAGLPPMIVYQPLQFSSVLYDINPLNTELNPICQ